MTQLTFIADCPYQSTSFRSPPMGFTEENFCSVIKGIKTETRRLASFGENEIMKAAKYRVGDRCYLTEPTRIDTIFAHVAEVDHRWYKAEKVGHKITENDLTKIKSRKGGMYKETIARFMLKNFARYHVEITNVRIERLMDITEESAIAEGIKYIKRPELACPVYFDYIRNEYLFADPKDSYISEIEMLHGKAIAASNPWLWVYKFKLATS